MTTSSTPTHRTWFITGASSGIGLALATAAAERGDQVVALARSVDRLAPLVAEHGDRVLALAVDVRDAVQVEDSVQQAVRRFGRLDVVANNAGYGVFGAVEEATADQARGIWETNVLGVLNVLRSTLPVLRAQRSGHVLQGSSYYGQTAHAGVGLLAATKYAVEGLSDALVGEVGPLGIGVTLVEPGPTATAFLDNLDLTGTIGDYDATVRAVQKEIGELPASAFTSPEGVVATIFAAVDSANPPVRLATGRVAVAEMRTALQARLAELESWASVSEAADTVDARA
ncbi:MAG: SDR family NAD(P)-dependent oxidoreductase [Janthinobacterium lividum]